MFSSLFEKPKMSEKLLIKPPFKYIFDIIIETSATTGFARDLFQPVELSPEFYSTKENKILFLKKVQV
jgi:TRAF3-interacting protein 1